MQATRRARLESVILEELSQLIPRELKDPRVVPLTITKVEATQDGEQATISFVLFGALAETETAEPTPEQKRRITECIRGLHAASGFLRRHLARALNIRHVPELVFKEDRGLSNTLRVHELLKKIEDEKKTDAPKPPASSNE